LTLSGPIVLGVSRASSHLTFAGDAANSARPAPASVIFDVDAKTNARLACPW
jgi:hypothetical protein